MYINKRKVIHSFQNDNRKSSVQFIDCRPLSPIKVKQASSPSSLRILQRREIIGNMYLLKKGGFEHRGTTNPEGIPISNLLYGMIHKHIIKPEYLERVNMKAHLVKALWDGGNETNRITQWQQGGIHEQEWTRFENKIEDSANKHRGNTQPWTVKTITDDPNIGDKLLGTYSTAQKNFSGITVVEYNNAKTTLNRQISNAKIYLNDKFIGELNCPDISKELKLNIQKKQNY